MSLAECKTKSEVIEKYRVNEKDTGSPEVQIALITKRLKDLEDHFSKNPKDNHSKRGLLQMVSQRKRLLSYLKSESISRYSDALVKFGLRK